MERTARQTVDARIAYLRSRGEDVRNTVAWRDACHEEWWVSYHERVTRWYSAVYPVAS